VYQRERVDLTCRKCGGEMQDILSIAPTIKEPGLVVYEYRRGHKSSGLKPMGCARQVRKELYLLPAHGLTLVLR
jgi:hypothetical protein